MQGQMLCLIHLFMKALTLTQSLMRAMILLLLSMMVSDRLNLSALLLVWNILNKLAFYVGVIENEAVPQDYLDTNIPIAEQQIVIGGYRLAYVIDYIFSESSWEYPIGQPFFTNLEKMDFVSN